MHLRNQKNGIEKVKLHNKLAQLKAQEAPFWPSRKPVPLPDCRLGLEPEPSLARQVAITRKTVILFRSAMQVENGVAPLPPLISAAPQHSKIGATDVG
jgi:hypothetical protein